MSQGGQTFSYESFKVIYGDTDFALSQWKNFLNALNNDTSSPYYQNAMSKASVTLMPGYVASLYASGAIGVETFSGIIEYTDPNGNLYPSILEQMGLTDRYYSELDALNDSGDDSGDDPGYAEGDQVAWEDMTAEERNAHAVRRYAITGEKNKHYEGMTQEQIDAAYEYLKTDGNPGVYGDQEGTNYSNYQTEIIGESALRDVLAEIGYSDYEIDDLMDTLHQPRINEDGSIGGFYGSLVISTILINNGYYNASQDWTVNPATGTTCTAEDGSIGEYVFGGECVSKGVGNAGDPCGFRGEGKKDERGNCIGGEENCSNKSYAEAFPDRCKEPDPDQELVDQYGQSAVDKAKEIYEGIKDTIQGAIDDPQGTLISILDNILPQIPEECQNEGTVGVDIPSDWWKDCVTVGVLLPGLNIPLPPGMIDVNATVRDLENAAKEVGKTLEDIFNPTCKGTPEEIEECENRTISDILGDWAADVWEGIKDAWEDLEDKTDAGLLNILIDMGYSILGPLIFSQIKETIIGNTNPFAFLQNCYDGDWAKQTPENQAFCNEALNEGALIRCQDDSYRQTQAECAEGEFGFCEDGTTQKTDAKGTNCTEYAPFGFCDDEKTPKTDEDGTECPGYQAPFDCSSVGRKDPEDGSTAYKKEDCSEECADPENQEFNTESGNCTDKGPITPTEEDCANKGLKYDDLNDECLDECEDLEESPTGPNGECVPTTPWTNSGPTEDTCTQRGKSFIPADEANEVDSKCGDCLEKGFVHDGAGTNCYDPNPEPEPCPGNQQRFDGENCEEPCEFDNTISVSDPACKDPNTGNDPQAGDPCDSTGDGVKDGTLQANESGELECVAGQGPDECTEITEENYERCGKKSCGNGVYVDKDAECPSGGGDLCQDGSTPDPDKGCREDWCDDAMTIPKNADGSCPEGPIEECVKPDGTPTGATVESGCEECPQGQQFNDQGICVGPDPVICDDPEATNYGEEGECVFGPDPVICDDPEATNYGEEGKCVYGPDPVICDDPEATNYGEEGKCVYGPDPDPCDDAVYASENPLECGWVECPDGSFAPTKEQCPGGCPEGQEPCEALGGECTTPENCPGGDDGGGGGGGSGMFTGAKPVEIGFDIAGDPQLLARQEFPITDYLAGLFKGIV